MDSHTISPKEFLNSIKHFQQISDQIKDGWLVYENEIETYKSYIKKETFITCEIHNKTTLCKMEYIIFFNLSYGVPSFSFNVWDSSGTLLKLEDIRRLSLIQYVYMFVI